MLVAMPDKCAYYRKQAPLTREYVYPKSLYGRQGAQHSGYNEAADKVTSGERVIQDVCVASNSESPRKLDDCGKEYYKQNSVEHTFTDGPDYLVYYGYNRLLRWVLNISYNSYRTVNPQGGLFRSLVPYILTGLPQPKRRFVNLFSELFRDYRLTNSGRLSQ